MKRYRLRRAIRILSVVILFIGLAGLAVMTLWNALLPSILGVSSITFWQALGLMLLSRLLLGFPRGGWGRGQAGSWAGRTHSGRTEWKQKMAERWQQMSPEQREQMKTQWRTGRNSGWCGSGARSRWDEPEQKASDESAPQTGPETTS